MFYDKMVYNYFCHNEGISLDLRKDSELRYGENPHQEANLLIDEMSPIDFSNPLQGKQISYNNVADALSAWACVNEFEEPAVCIVKHTNPCGVATDQNLNKAYGPLTARTLFSRLSRALVDENYNDSNGWITKAKDMFFKNKKRWDDQNLSRELGNVLGCLLYTSDAADE